MPLGKLQYIPWKESNCRIIRLSHFVLSCGNISTLLDTKIGLENEANV